MVGDDPRERSSFVIGEVMTLQMAIVMRLGVTGGAPKVSKRQVHRAKDFFPSCSAKDLGQPRSSAVGTRPETPRLTVRAEDS